MHFKKIYQNNPLLGIFFTGFFFRFVWMIAMYWSNGAAGFTTYDSNAYKELAYNLIEFNSFGRFSENIWYPEYFRTPVFPLFLSFFYFLSDSEYPILFSQILLGSFTGVFTFLAARIWTNRLSGAWAAGLIVALDIPSILISNLMLSETLFTFLISAAFCLLIFLLKKEPILPLSLLLILCGLSLSLAILTRPFALNFTLLFGTMIFIHFRKGSSLLLFLLPILLLVVPWSMRNQKHAGTLFLSTAGIDVFYYYPTAAVYSAQHNLPLRETRNLLELKVREEIGLESSRRISVQKDIIIDLIKKHPMAFLKEFGKGIFYFAAKPARDLIERQLGINQSLKNPDETNRSKLKGYAMREATPLAKTLAILQILQLAELWILFGLGMYLIIQMKDLPIFFLVLFSLALFAFSIPGADSDSRFRVPAIPMLAIVASLGFVYIKTLIDSLRKNKKLD